VTCQQLELHITVEKVRND